MNQSQPDTTSEHTPAPWFYRPDKHDDWGWIRGPQSIEDEIAPLVACVRSGQWESAGMMDEHRRAGTDPYEANAVFIVEAVNSLDALKARIEELEKALREFVEAYKLQDCDNHTAELARAYSIADATLDAMSTPVNRQCACMRGGYPIGNCVECDVPAARDAALCVVSRPGERNDG